MEKTNGTENWAKVSAGMTLLLIWVVQDVGLRKLLTIPELDPKRQRQEFPLTKENALRISLIQNIARPRYNIRPTIDPSSIRADWVQVPAHLFVYGPILDLVNALQGKQIVKVCWNCGRLYRPYRYQKEGQRYCCSTCRKRGQSKRLYQDKKRE